MGYYEQKAKWDNEQIENEKNEPINAGPLFGSKFADFVALSIGILIVFGIPVSIILIFG